MKAFAELMDQLYFAAARNRKVELMRDYFSSRPDPERGYALAAITNSLTFPEVKPNTLRPLIEKQIDPVLFDLCRDYVGDLAETIALLWPGDSRGNLPDLPYIVEQLMAAKKKEVPELLLPWLDAADETERWALLKLVTGGLRIGVSERLAKVALAEINSGITIEEIEELWHGLAPPYEDLFAWIDGRAEKPDVKHAHAFRPVMLAHPIEEAELEKVDPAIFAAEWKWDGIRVQLAGDGETIALYSRTGEDIAPAFPDLWALRVHGVFDGELLVVRDGALASFNELQQRLNRKNPTSKMLGEYPAHLRLYDMLFDGDEDIRGLPFVERRARLEAWYARYVAAVLPLPLPGGGRVGVELSTNAGVRGAFRPPPQSSPLKGEEESYLGELRSHSGARAPTPSATEKQESQDNPLSLQGEGRGEGARHNRISLSPLVDFEHHGGLRAMLDVIRSDLKDMQAEGFMLKRKDAPYLAGRPKGYWYKWKRDTLKADVVMMYAQRGHGKRSSFYSDFTFGCWTGEGEARHLVPVGKAYSGYTDEELVKLDKWIRAHTTGRFGPVREVEKGLVLEVEFDSIARSERHKSGVAMRFPRVHRIRWDKPAAEADELAALMKYLAG